VHPRVILRQTASPTQSGHRHLQQVRPDPRRWGQQRLRDLRLGSSCSLMQRRRRSEVYFCLSEHHFHCCSRLLCYLMQSRRCCDRYAQDETANLTYMCSYGYTCPTHQISSLETKYSARISAGGQNPICKMRSKCGQRNRTSSPKTGHFRMHLRDTYAGTFSVGPRPGHANCERVTA
jgi:hypothetical protein